MLTATFIVLAILALTLSVAASRVAGRACYRINRDAYYRVQADWAEHRRASPRDPA